MMFLILTQLTQMKLFSILAATLFIFGACTNSSAPADKPVEEKTDTVAETTPEVEEAATKVLFVLTSHSQLGDTEKETGYWLSEITHPWKELTEAGYEVDFVSPQGGEPQMDPGSMDTADAVNMAFLADSVYQAKMKNTLTPDQIDVASYPAILFVGGHGVMWDLPENADISKIAANIYENNGVVSAVCHGPAGLVNITLSDSTYLVQGKKVSTFTNEEEKAIELDGVVPFSVEDKLAERGAIIEKGDMWAEQISVDGRLITGQNPQSAKAVGAAIVTALNAK